MMPNQSPEYNIADTSEPMKIDEMIIFYILNMDRLDIVEVSNY